MKKLFAVLIAITALAPFSAARSGVISFEDRMDLTETDWTEKLRFQKFDMRRGKLTSVQFELGGIVEGIGKAENKHRTNRSTITLSLSSLLELSRPDGSTLVVTNPVFEKTFNSVAKSDGNPHDFTGSSAVSTGWVKGSKTEFFKSMIAEDLKLFSSSSYAIITLPLTAIGTSEARSSGNVSSDFTTLASGYAKVIYTYTEHVVEIAEPATMTTIFAGLGLIAALRRRKGKQA
jgi:hypothetical protein